MIETETTKNMKAQVEELLQARDEQIVEAARAIRTAKRVEAKGDDPEYVEDLRVEAQFEFECGMEVQKNIDELRKNIAESIS